MPPRVRVGDSRTGTGSHGWPSTMWDLVQSCSDGSPDSRKSALEELFRRYYTPVRRFFQKALQVREQDLDDLTQEFFTRFIEKDFLKNLREQKSFRGFLRVACRRHFINWLEARNAPGRNGIPFNPAITENRIDGMIDDELRTWYLEAAVDQTRTELTAAGKASQFSLFEARAGLRNGRPVAYKDLATEFGISVFDVTNQLLAARKVFRRALLQRVSEGSAEPMEELRELGLQKYLT